MMTFLEYIFIDPTPIPWLVQDLIVLLLSLALILTIIRREEHPTPRLLEVVAFVFIYASVYENAAGVMRLYSFGRSYLMIGSVPATVPMIEAMVLVTGFWLLDKTALPNWTKPPIIGLLGMLQDFSLDPLAIRQVFETSSGISARWNWVIQTSDANILGVPVFNFPGWMLIMFYGALCLLIGRWWFKKSGYKPLVGYLYPFITMFVALLLMISPLSSFLLWLGPIFLKGSWIEWVMLGFHLLLPTALLIVIWRGKMKTGFDKQDILIFLIPLLLHLSDIVFSFTGGFTEILWIVILASAIHLGLLACFFLQGKRRIKTTAEPC